MKMLRYFLSFVMLAGASALPPETAADEPAEECACPDRSLLINDSSASAQRLDVALRIAWGHQGMAQGGQPPKTIETGMFLADEAARYSVKPECLAPSLRPKRKEIAEMQGPDLATCPTSAKDAFSLRALMDCGMRVYGCHLCIAKAIHPKCGSLIDANGDVDQTVWETAVMAGIRPIYERGAPDQINFFEMPYSDRLEVSVSDDGTPTMCPCSGVDAAVISF
jgi:hypothetical protein